jgi:hypothetical protein
MKKSPVLWLCLFLLAAILLAAFAPLEQTLGANARLVYFHGAWVWTAMAAFIAAALAGLVGLLTRRSILHEWSRALGRTGLFFWITFLPMSMIVMQANWNGLYLDEPRFRVPLNYAIVGLLLQIGLVFLPIVWTSLANIAYAVALLAGMSSVQAILHPESPIFNSNARDIQLYFLGMLILLLAAAWQMARVWVQLQVRRSGQLQELPQMS